MPSGGKSCGADAAHFHEGNLVQMKSCNRSHANEVMQMNLHPQQRKVAREGLNNSLLLVIPAEAGIQ